MEDYSWKNLKRGVRRLSAKKHKQYKPRKIYICEPNGVSAHVFNHVVVRGMKEGRCSCWNELPKDSCGNCRKRLDWKAGELSLDDSWDLYW